MKSPVLGWLAILAFALLSACASLGVPPADTFAKRLAAGYVTVNTVSDSTAKLLAARRITLPEARKVHAGLDDALAGLDAARTLSNTDLGAAETRLQATVHVLTALQALLATKQGTP